MSFTGKRVLHVKRMHVELIGCEGSKLAFDICNSWHRTTANIVRHSAPTHGRPIKNAHTLDICVRTTTANKLLEGLQSVENSSGTCTSNDNTLCAYCLLYTSPSPRDS